jgi:DNA-binding response OmpR family regulator
MSRQSRPTIFIIEADTSLQRLITLGLQYRGTHVIAASSLSNLSVIEATKEGDRKGSPLPRDDEPSINVGWVGAIPCGRPAPGLVILDIDNEMSSNWSLLTTLEAYPHLSTLPIIVLAWECSLPEDLLQSSFQAKITCLTKPFDARTLYTTIEELLVATTPQSEESLLAAQAATPAPSIWPLVTAAGLLLTFIGVMVQFVLVAVGIVIVMAALLWWTLGTKTEVATFPIRVDSS